MSKLLPRVFVGSSSEVEVFAKAFCNVLSDCAEVVAWRDAPEFKPMANILDALGKAAFNYDFGVFILAPDDVTESRGTKKYSTRDNVLFELGLFLGGLGPDRAIAVVQRAKEKSKRVKVPSDLVGIIMPEFPSPPLTTKKKITVKQAQELIEAAAGKVRAVIQEHGLNLNMDLLISYGPIRNEKAFAMEIGAEKLKKYFGKLKGKRLIVIARKDYDGGIADEDKEIAKSKIVNVPDYEAHDINIKAKGSSIFDSLKPGDMLEGYLLLVPPAVNIQAADSLGELYKMGCKKICKRGYEIQEED